MKPASLNPSQPIENLCFGSIIEVDGTTVTAELDKSIRDLTRIFEGNTYYVGQYGSIVKIHFGRKTLYGYVSRLKMVTDIISDNQQEKEARIIELNLFGEGEWSAIDSKWSLNFTRGVSNFPLPLQKVYLTPNLELKEVFKSTEKLENFIKIGTYSNAIATDCLADLNELLGKHSAILGSTGSGKSGAVTVVLKSILIKSKDFKKWHPRIVILDPHNEYSKAFKDVSKLYSTDQKGAIPLKLPYWLLNLNEFVDLFIESNASVQKNILKDQLLKLRIETAKILKLDHTKITVDSPIPFEINKLQKEIEDTAKTKSAADKKPYDSLLLKIQSLCEDSRYDFLMSNWASGNDEVNSIIKQFISDEKPIQIIDLSGLPNEVAGIVSSVIARTLFSFKVWESIEEREQNPILLVCEEAHRYVPNRGEAQYQGAQEAIKRIAKEGRKYGLSFMLVSQRPSEIESTVLSQANSWLVLRLTNDTDREYVKGMLPDTLAGLTRNLSTLRKREAIFVGLAALIPSKILLNFLPENERPKSNDVDFIKGWQNDVYDDKKITEIINRWRLQTKD